MNAPTSDTKFVRLNLRIPHKLANQLRQLASKNMRSLNNEIVMRLASAVNAEESAKGHRHTPQT